MELEVMASHGALPKVGVFVLVQALVYLILSQTSAVFSKTKSIGLHPARSLSARRMLALLSDLPPLGRELSSVAVAGKLSPVPAHRKED